MTAWLIPAETVTPWVTVWAGATWRGRRVSGGPDQPLQSQEVVMNRFHISRRLAVIVAGLGGVLLGLSAAAVPAAAARMVPLGDPHGRPVLAIPRPEPPARNQPGSLRAAPGSELTLAQAPAGLRAAVRRSLGVPAASASSAGRQAELTAADGAPGDIFGFSVALSGRTAVVGAPFKNSNNGAAYVFVRSGTTWSQQAKLTIAHGAAGRRSASRWPSRGGPWWWAPPSRPSAGGSPGRRTCSCGRGPLGPGRPSSPPPSA